MKKIFKIFSLALLAVVGLCFTSCGDDDDDNGIKYPYEIEYWTSVAYGGEYSHETITGTYNPIDELYYLLYTETAIATKAIPEDTKSFTIKINAKSKEEAIKQADAQAIAKFNAIAPSLNNKCKDIETKFNNKKKELAKYVLDAPKKNRINGTIGYYIARYPIDLPGVHTIKNVEVCDVTALGGEDYSK